MYALSLLLYLPCWRVSRLDRLGMIGQEMVLVLFGCALFAAALFVYVFYQPERS